MPHEPAQSIGEQARTNAGQARVLRRRLDTQFEARASGRTAKQQQESHSISALLGDRNEQIQGRPRPWDAERVESKTFGQYAAFDQAGRRSTTAGLAILRFEPRTGEYATYQGPIDGDGSIPDWVTNVAIIMPGTGTGLRTLFGDVGRTKSFFNAANADPYRSTTALITYVGGRMPQRFITEAVSGRYARVIAPRLKRFVEALARPHGCALTIVAHSYASVIVTQAERLGMRCDRVVHIAPAGYGSGVTSLRDLPAEQRKAPHFLLQSERDRIAPWSQRTWLLGGNPLRDPVLVRLDTGAGAALLTNCRGELFSAHNAPFDNADSPARRSIINVINGGNTLSR